MKYDSKADVYSYGIVMWEIGAQQEPWPDVGHRFLCDALLRLVRAGTRPPVGVGWPTMYVTTMTHCWATVPASRPAFAALMLIKDELPQPRQLINDELPPPRPPHSSVLQ